MSELITLFKAVQTDARADIDAFLAALKQETANARLEELSAIHNFKTLWDPQQFDGNRIMLAQDLSQIMYGTSDVSSLGKLLRRYDLGLYTIGTSVHDGRKSIKVHFNLSRHAPQQSFATWTHFLMAGMKGETLLARQVCAYLLAMEEQGRIAEAQQPLSLRDMFIKGWIEHDDRLDGHDKHLEANDKEIANAKQEAKEAKVIAINAQTASLRTEQAFVEAQKARLQRAQMHLEGEHDSYMRARLYEFCLGHCPRCKVRLTLEYGHPHSIEIDEVVPRAHGGNRAWDNVQPLCRTCNGLKRDAAKRGEWLGRWDFRNKDIISGCDREQRKYNRRMNAKDNPLDPWLFPDEGVAD